MASALLVEVLVSVIQHPLGASAPAPANPTEERGDHPLGIVPHQIRGFLSSFQNMVIKGSSYDCCSACSSPIVDAYRNDGWDFVKKALNEKGFVEDLSGLTAVRVSAIVNLQPLKKRQVQRAAEKALAEMEWSDEGDSAEDEGEGELI